MSILLSLLCQEATGIQLYQAQTQLLQVNPLPTVVHFMPANISLGQQAINELVACCDCCCPQDTFVSCGYVCLYEFIFNFIISHLRRKQSHPKNVTSMSNSWHGQATNFAHHKVKPTKLHKLTHRYAPTHRQSL